MQITQTRVGSSQVHKHARKTPSLKREPQNWEKVKFMHLCALFLHKKGEKPVKDKTQPFHPFVLTVIFKTKE